MRNTELERLLCVEKDRTSDLESILNGMAAKKNNDAEDEQKGSEEAIDVPAANVNDQVDVLAEVRLDYFCAHIYDVLF